MKIMSNYQFDVVAECLIEKVVFAYRNLVERWEQEGIAQVGDNLNTHPYLLHLNQEVLGKSPVSCSIQVKELTLD
jgi:hypothetical protein